MGALSDLISAPLTNGARVGTRALGALLPEVNWAGLALNDERADGTALVVSNFSGWYGTSDATVGDVARALVDGMVPGPKVLGPAEMTLEGYVAGGTRATVMGALDALAARAGARDPAVMVVSDPRLGRSEQRELRATGALSATWIGPNAFSYNVALRATDPRRYSTQLNSVTLFRGTGETGRLYPRTYSWRYRSPVTTTGAILANEGNVPAPVLLTYTGDFSASRVTDGRTGTINVEPLPGGMRLFVNSDTLAIWAPGGYSRARFLQPGSRPMTVPPGSVRWSLYVQEGHGTVQLQWRSAWL